MAWLANSDTICCSSSSKGVDPGRRRVNSTPGRWVARAQRQRQRRAELDPQPLGEVEDQTVDVLRHVVGEDGAGGGPGDRYRCAGDRVGAHPDTHGNGEHGNLPRAGFSLLVRQRDQRVVRTGQLPCMTGDQMQGFCGVTATQQLRGDLSGRLEPPPTAAGRSRTAGNCRWRCRRRRPAREPRSRRPR